MNINCETQNEITYSELCNKKLISDKNKKLYCIVTKSRYKNISIYSCDSNISSYCSNNKRSDSACIFISKSAKEEDLTHELLHAKMEIDGLIDCNTFESGFYNKLSKMYNAGEMDQLKNTVYHEYMKSDFEKMGYDLVGFCVSSDAYSIEDEMTMISQTKDYVINMSSVKSYINCYVNLRYLYPNKEQQKSLKKIYTELYSFLETNFSFLENVYNNSRFFDFYYDLNNWLDNKNVY